jgi:cytochrome c biogenesis protein CcmG/thiol:disulfide interchange protein DsbE
MKLRYLLPLFIFIIITSILWRGLGLHPNTIPSPFINKTVPIFSLPSLNDRTPVTQNDFRGQVSLFNVWATWCYACAFEHDFLLDLSKNKNIVLYGLNYKDDPLAAKKWLKAHGNPYHRIAVDRSGDTGINFGVYGTPETFIIDKKGVIRYKQIGPLTPEIWDHDIKPIIEKLQNES